jgi:membrane protein DedA with SNARE-associated domain
MRDELLAALSQYGSPALFVVAAVASVGLPLPVALLLIVTGSLVAQGVMDLWWAIGLASAGAVAGDLIGYAIGRWGGGTLLPRLSRLLGGAERLDRAEARVRSWGWAGVFFTRWLLTPLGPWVNLASGISRYSWGRFLLWDVLGECLCVVIYVTLGWVFSDSVMSLDSVLGELTWATVALAAAALLGWKLVSLLRRAPEKATSTET